MSGNTRKNQVTRLVTLRHRSTMSGALDPDHMPNGQRLLHVVADRIQWQTALELARRRAAESDLRDIHLAGVG